MAVLVEAISVIVRAEAIKTKFRGGWDRFVSLVPNRTLCADGELARVGFMTPDDVGSFIQLLEQNGLTFLDAGQAIDVAVVDQQRGLTTKCTWLDGARTRIAGGGLVSLCWHSAEPRSRIGIRVGDKAMSLATPPGWKYENSLSHKFTFVPTEEVDQRLRFVRNEDPVDVALDRKTSGESYTPASPDRHRPAYSSKERSMDDEILLYSRVSAEAIAAALEVARRELPDASEKKLTMLLLGNIAGYCGRLGIDLDDVRDLAEGMYRQGAASAIR